MATRSSADTKFTPDAMQSTVRSVTPRLVAIESPPSNLIHNDQDSIVSSQPNGPTRRAIYSIMPSISSEHIRAHSSQSSATASSEPQFHRRKSESGLLDRGTLMRPHASLLRQSSQDLALLESNRQSMKELSDFLRTKEPPPDNWMSIPNSVENDYREGKKSPFKIFRRQNSKKAKSPRLLRLPDTAVAARTLGGFRHISISIPVEYDHLGDTSPSQYLTPCRPQPPSKRVVEISERNGITDRGAITVFKPVTEVRESDSSYDASVQRINGETGRISRVESIPTPAAEVLGAEATKTLQDYYSQLNKQQKCQGFEDAPGIKSEPAPPQKSYVAVSAVDIAQQDSQCTDPRHSGGTAYSERTLTSIPNHSQEPSSVSTAPNAALITSLKLDLSPRKSSISTAPRILLAEPSTTSRMTLPSSAIERVREDLSRSPVLSIKSVDDSLYSDALSPSAVIGTVETAQGYSTAGTVSHQSLSGHKQPKPAGAAPNRSTQAAFSTRELISTSLNNTAAESILMTRQNRQYRVKARKLRDMAALRARSETNISNHQLEASQTTRTFPILLRGPKRRSLSNCAMQKEIAWRKNANVLTPIMPVADLAPYTSVYVPKDTNRSPLSEAHAPPRSTTHSLASDDETLAKSRPRSIMSSSHRPIKPDLGTCRQARRVKRNMSLREKELDARLTKIEKDNAMLINRLDNISKSLADLNRVVLLGQRKSKRASSLLTDGAAVPPELRRLDSTKPLMQELQDGARFSQERKREVLEDDQDETSIL